MTVVIADRLNKSHTLNVLTLIPDSLNSIHIIHFPLHVTVAEANRLLACPANAIATFFGRSHDLG